MSKTIGDYRCTECGNRHKNGDECPQVGYNIAVAEQKGYLQALDDVMKEVNHNNKFVVGLIALDQIIVEPDDLRNICTDLQETRKKLEQLVQLNQEGRGESPVLGKLNKDELIIIIHGYQDQLDNVTGQLAESQAYADKLAAGLPDGMLPKDVENLREANTKFAQDNFILQRQLAEANEELTHYRGFVDSHSWLEYRARIEKAGG